MLIIQLDSFSTLTIILNKVYELQMNSEPNDVSETVREVLILVMIRDKDMNEYSHSNESSTHVKN